ncbi:MAG: hypothetical protein K2Y23_11825 [Cyanobacteria bacterium]|nr:hypothetical protein [Cyanobacteriota bacterium]
MNDDDTLDLNRAFVATTADIEALRVSRASVPSWLSLDWRTIAAMQPPAAGARRSTAQDEWLPFSLDQCR